jgi:DNA-binding transcriptional LysR family regulator
MELRHLRYFIAVCDTLHFGRAAEQMHIAQPALSQQIINLEGELGIELFVRTKRHVELTAAGQMFSKRARFILNNVKFAIQEVRANGFGENLQLRIGVLSSIQLSQLVPLIGKFRAKHPEVHLSIMQMPTHLQLGELTSGALDVGFMDATSATLLSGATATPISSMDVLREELVAAVPVTHPLANRSEIKLEELSSSAFLFTARTSPCSLASRIHALCDVAGFTPRLQCEVTDLPSALALVAADCGVTLAPACAIALWQKDIRFIPLSMKPTISVAMAWRSDDTSMHLETFCKTVAAFPTEMLRTSTQTPSSLPEHIVLA